MIVAFVVACAVVVLVASACMVAHVLEARKLRKACEAIAAEYTSPQRGFELGLRDGGCRMTHPLGSESGSCPCTGPSECRVLPRRKT